ncbi:sigma factor G inhibitor Gin [Sporolactobacillus shoreicorticis]|uniref:Sigma factor G inhibitor Gin n=1 Tax=Sporolactobacillus shoreicorticis TaxID=1923877 RepID=A0ABW5S861_9BACL|nr:sigma factor G inhibitor Gin [Sporolactobacillus shoreicorticis]MCO7127701.1 sigma factor G inhibitor Gin [Sporolactobacillus shoreicorticis]
MAMHKLNQAKEACLICGQENVEGIHICNQLICDSCQKRIVETDVTDWKYKFYMNKLAKLRIGQKGRVMETAVIHAGSGGEAGKS